MLDRHTLVSWNCQVSHSSGHVTNVFILWLVCEKTEKLKLACVKVSLYCVIQTKNPLSFTLQPVFAVGIISTNTNSNTNYYTFPGGVHWEQCILLFQECPDHIHTRAAGDKGLAREHLGVGNGASNALIDSKIKSNEMERKKSQQTHRYFWSVSHRMTTTSVSDRFLFTSIPSRHRIQNHSCSILAFFFWLLLGLVYCNE